MLPVELSELVAGWPYVLSLAAAAGVGGLRSSRRRAALNEALHELRRPLQALALAQPARREPAAGSVRMAAVALERLEREINGEPAGPVRAAVAVEALLADAVRRWRPLARRLGGSLELRWRAGETTVCGDAEALARAVENLVVNAVEHGGPRVEVAAEVEGPVLRVTVRDPGRGGRADARPGSRLRFTRGAMGARIAGARGRVSGRSRRGHGLRVVRRVAAEHGGSFSLRAGSEGADAVLELPLVGAGINEVSQLTPVAEPAAGAEGEPDAELESENTPGGRV